MAKVQLKSFEKRIRVRSITMADYENLVELQLLCFPGMKPWTREQIESQLRLFPDGQVCVELDGKLVASSSSLIVDFDLYSDWHAWKEISDSGFIRNHVDDGDTLYGIEIMVHPEFRGLRLSRRLYEARKRIAVERNIARIVIGGRIPGYGKHADKMSAREYVEKVRNGGLYDQVLSAQLANGFVLKRLIENYMPSDVESRGYATFLEWPNIDYVPESKRQYQAVKPARLFLVQYQMRPIKNFAEFAQQAAFFSDVASDYQSDFVVFPELFTTQLLSFVKAKRPSDAARKLAEMTPQYLELFTKLAIKHNVNIVGGSQFFLEDDVLYNVSVLFHRDGRLSKQYKMHITPQERRWWGVQPGKKIEVFDTDRGKVAIIICYDVEFPELCRIAAAKGAEIFIVPFNTDERHGYLRVRHCAQARAIENDVYVAIAGCVGNLPFVDNADIHYAQSAVLTPADVPFSRDGIAAECNPNVETVVVHDVDTELLRRHKLQGNVTTWTDRRRDLYQIRWHEPGEKEMREI